MNNKINPSIFFESQDTLEIYIQGMYDLTDALSNTAVGSKVKKMVIAEANRLRAEFINKVIREVYERHTI
jgi:hypothetical protein